MEECKYRLPCGRCDKFNKECDAPKDNVLNECEHSWEVTSFDLKNDDLYFYYTCRKCGSIRVTPLSSYVFDKTKNNEQCIYELKT